MWSGRDRFTARWRRADAAAVFTPRTGRRGLGCRRPRRRTAEGAGPWKLTGSRRSLDMHLPKREGPTEVSRLSSSKALLKAVIIRSLLMYVLKLDLLHTLLKIAVDSSVNVFFSFFLPLAVTFLLTLCPPRYRQAPVGSQGPCSSYASYSGT